MSLLQVLKLPVPPAFLPTGGAVAPPPLPSVQPKEPERGGAKAGDKPVGGGDDARAEALKVRAAIEARRKETADLLLRMQKAEPVLKARLDAASGDEKKKLAEQQALLSRKMADAERSLKRAQADLDAIDNPGSKREELLAILARQKAAGKVAEKTEITSPGLDPSKQGKLNKDATKTTTSYADGKAKTEKVHEQQKVGLGGYSKTQSRDQEVTDGKTTARSSDEKKTQVSLTGKVTKEEKKSSEIELADGSKAGVERSKSQELSSKGASKTETVKQTNFDGSSNTVTKKQGIEREDGKVTANKSESVTKTNKSGTSVTTDKGASGGFVSGKDGSGVQGKVSGGKSVTNKQGLQAGVVGGLHANVMCKVGEPKGEPKMYPVTVTVSFGASLAVSGGAGKKEGSKVSGSVELKGGEERTMSVTHHFTEAELGDYTKAMQAASKGVVAGKHDEFKIIAMGVKKNWDEARKLWKPGSQDLSKATTDGLKRTGDSIQVGKTSTRGGGVKGQVAGVGGGYGVTDTNTESTTVTRNEQGGLDVDAKQEQGREKTGSVSMQAGVAGLEVGKTHVHKTRFGYSISIDPKMDPDGKILEALSYCKTEQHYDLFLLTHKGKVKVLGKSKGRTDGQSTQVGASVGKVKLEMSTNKSVDEDVTVDDAGKVTNQMTVGRAGAGGKLGGRADSSQDEAVAQTDGQGNSNLTLTTTTKQNYGSRAKEREKQKKSSGGKVSDEDKETKDVSGLGLSTADLKRLGDSAMRSLPFWDDQYRRTDEKQDWKKAGRVIVAGGGSASAVAHALAKFVGGDEVERMKTVMHLVRGGYRQNMGKAFEFPDSIRDIRDDYDLVSDDKLDKKMNAYANKNGDPAAVKECKRLLAIVDRIQPRVEGCKDFSNTATKTEMMSELLKCRTMLNRGVEGFAGKLKPEDDPKVLATEGDRLMKLCNAYGVEQANLVSKLEDQDAITVSERSEGKKLIKQLDNMQQRWWNDWHRLKDNYAKRKIALPEFPYARNIPQIKPFEALIGIYEKKFVR